MDGLKAEDVLRIYSEAPIDILSEHWKHPIEAFGVFFVATRIQDTGQASALRAYVRRNAEANNRVLLSDMIAALFSCEKVPSDFGGMRFHDGRFTQISLSDYPVNNIHFSDCVFDYIDLTEEAPRGVQISDSLIIKAGGVTMNDLLPPWITNCLIQEFQSVNTLTEIRLAGLTTAQTFLMSSLRKLFLQPGGGRKHSSMYKGYGDAATKKVCEKVIHLLVHEGFCSRTQGATEDLCIPDRSLTSRAKLIMNRMTQSNDPVWLQVSRFK